MRPFSKVFICTLLLSSLVICISCKKEGTKTPLPAVSNLPGANAGADQTITYPIDSVDLIGSGTGKIISYKWSQISGPNQSTILDSALAKTTVKNLVRGIYEFQLIVTDAFGNPAGDIVIINVNLPSTVQLIPVGQLSIKRDNVAMVAAGNKIFFAGGIPGLMYFNKPLSSRVDIYDVITKTWSTAELSKGRSDIGAVAVGNKILFAGGADNWTGDFWGDVQLSTRVDIYDITTNKWSKTEMPEPVWFNYGWAGTTAAAGNKAIFCSESNVYIYDVSNNSWTTSSLSTSRNDLASASLGNKIFIAGEGTKNVDVYDVNTNLWTIDSLSESRGMIRAASLNNKAFFAGGGFYPDFTDKVDIYDDVTQTWSVSHLSRANILEGAASSGNKMLFFSYTTLDIYDTSTNTWSVSNLSESFGDGSEFISAGGNAYATKGDQVWRVQL